MKDREGMRQRGNQKEKEWEQERVGGGVWVLVLWENERGRVRVLNESGRLKMSTKWEIQKGITLVELVTDAKTHLLYRLNKQPM